MEKKKLWIVRTHKMKCTIAPSSQRSANSMWFFFLIYFVIYHNTKYFYFFFFKETKHLIMSHPCADFMNFLFSFSFISQFIVSRIDCWLLHLIVDQQKITQKLFWMFFLFLARAFSTNRCFCSKFFFHSFVDTKNSICAKIGWPSKVEFTEFN